MSSVLCPEHGSPGARSCVVLPERPIRTLPPTDAAIHRDEEGWCGHHGDRVTGRPPMVGRHRPAV